jgi:RNA polymerase sigma-70 factor (ECF subfamily)
VSLSRRNERGRDPARGGTGSRPSHGVIRSLPFDGDEAALVSALRARRADAGAALYDRYVRSIHALVFRLMGPDGEIDDVVHDVFVRALESLPRLRDPSAMRSWLFGIAVRTVAIRFQKRRRQRWLRFMSPDDVPDVPAFPDAELREALRDAYTILRGMDTEERIALVLHRVEGLSLEDGARAMGLSFATFRRRLARGEEKFFTRARNRPALDAWVGGGDHE